MLSILVFKFGEWDDSRGRIDNSRHDLQILSRQLLLQIDAQPLRVRNGLNELGLRAAFEFSQSGGQAALVLVVAVAEHGEHAVASVGQLDSARVSHQSRVDQGLFPRVCFGPRKRTLHDFWLLIVLITIDNRIFWRRPGGTLFHSLIIFFLLLLLE